MSAHEISPSPVRRWVIRIGKPAYHMYLVRVGPAGEHCWSYDLGRAARFATEAGARAIAQRTSRWCDSEHRAIEAITEVRA